MPIAVTDEQMAMAESVGQWVRDRAGAIALVRGLEGRGGRLGDRRGVSAAAGPAAEYWAGLAGLGVFSIALPGAAGGAGGTVADLAVAVEQLAAGLAPGPVLPTLLAGLLIARWLGPEHPLLADLATGAACAAVALSPGTLTGVWLPDGTLRVSGTADLVLGGGDSAHLLAGTHTDTGETWFATPVGLPGSEVADRCPVDFSRSLADVTLTDVVVQPVAQIGRLHGGLVRDLAAMLAASEAAGVAAWCSQTAAQHARTRHQFGQPIGSFQAVKHLCAGMLCRAELAAAAAWDAACAADDAPDEFPLAAAAAAAVALDAAVENAKDCIQVLGGIGFTWEHDAHLYLRRAVALRQLLGGSEEWRARTAGLGLSGVRRRKRGGGSLRVNNSPSDHAVRLAARACAERIAGLPPDQQRAALADSGYAAPHWPEPYGRSAAGPAQLVIDDELGSAGLTRPDLAIGGWAVPAILGHGSPAQKDRFAGPTLRGEITWCQLFSEPEAGSDLASLRTKAVRVDGGWLLTGQKVWTSLAAQADWAICLARTDPDLPKHEGITFFLVRMDSPGIDNRPLREITGCQMFNEVFLDQVLVPDDCVVGEPGAGWRIARSTLANERVAMGRGQSLDDEVEGVLAVAGVALGPTAEPVIMDQVGARLAEGLALSAMDDRLALAALRGADPGFASAVRKLLGVDHRQAVAETALALCGADGAPADGAGAGPVHQFLLTRCLSIAGGTSQILMSLVAERVLGLPREEAR